MSDKQFQNICLVKKKDKKQKKRNKNKQTKKNRLYPCYSSEQDYINQTTLGIICALNFCLLSNLNSIMCRF